MGRRAMQILATLSVLAALTTPTAAPAAAHGSDDFETTVVAFVGSATDLDFLPDGRMLVATKLGQVRIVDDGTVLPTPALDISAAVCTEVERGLSGLTVHPDFAENGWVYVFYTYPKHGNCGESGTTGPANRRHDSNLFGARTR